MKTFGELKVGNNIFWWKNGLNQKSLKCIITIIKDNYTTKAVHRFVIYVENKHAELGEFAIDCYQGTNLAVCKPNGVGETNIFTT